ncbi:hypothetical protein EJP67_12535 [Variovorax guangxiensis]|uniref:DUF1795 domain-containing protein n=1 Tax=Variovorax guangxiensis TaxID=1775474 RepID=A0A3S0ZEE2_9BURK|nr:hypothetical protein [Variovorax guangxiensis]RUR67884.1 hypothetical protein EJP67_12535 [Variovorax guangxiensis]
MRLLIAAFLSVLLCACASAPGTAPSATEPATESAPAQPTGVQWRYINSKSYEAANAGLGNSHRFESSVGWIDVYVYDMKRSWQPGVADPQFDDHFRSTIAEVQRAAAQGVYASVKIGPTKDVRIEGLTFRTVSFRLVHARDGKAYDSFTYLAVRNGKLLKYRMSFNTPAPANVDAISREFIERNVRTGPDTPVGTRQLRST